MPEPCYKDCANCPLVAAAQDEAERRRICAECPWEELPPGPSERLLFAMELAGLPGEALPVGEMTYTEAQDLGAVRAWRASRMMGLGV